MATLPQLQHRTVASAPVISKPGVADISGVGRVIGQGVEKVLNTRDNYELTKANSDALVAKIKLNQDLAEDRDYKTLPDRWRKGMADSLTPIVDGISNPSVRARFQAGIAPEIERGFSAATSRANDLEKDYERASTNTSLNDLMRGGLLSEDRDDRVHAISLAQARMDAGVGQGWYSAEESAKVVSDWKEDYAEGIVRQAAPEDRMMLLKDDIVKGNLSPDRLAVLEREATAAVLKQEAKSLATKARAEGQTSTDFIKFANTFDERKRSALVQEWQTTNNALRNAKLEQDEQIRQDWTIPILRQEKGFTDEEMMDNPAFQALEGGMKTLLLGLHDANVNSTRKESDFSAQATMSRLIHRDRDYEEGLRFVMENPEAFTPSDLKTWLSVSNKGVVADHYKDDFNLGHTIQVRLDDEGIDDDDALGQVRDTIMRISHEAIDAGKPLDSKEKASVIEKAIDSYYIRPQTGVWTTLGDLWRAASLTPDPRMIGRQEKPYFKMTDDERRRMRLNTYEYLDDVMDMPEGHGLKQVSMALMGSYRKPEDITELNRAHEVTLQMRGELPEEVLVQAARSLRQVNDYRLEQIKAEAEKTLGARINYRDAWELYAIEVNEE